MMEKGEKKKFLNAVKYTLVTVAILLMLTTIICAPDVSVVTKKEKPAGSIRGVTYEVRNGGLGMVEKCWLYLQVRSDLLDKTTSPWLLFENYEPVTEDDLLKYDLQAKTGYTIIKVNIGRIPPSWWVQNKKSVTIKIVFDGVSPQSDIFIEESYLVFSGFLDAMKEEYTVREIRAVAF